MSPIVQRSPRILKAPWVVPVTAAVLKDGAVVVEQGAITVVGNSSDIEKRFPDLPVTSCTGVLLPALVNSHIHLDLSVYGAVYPPSEDSSMCDWIAALLKERQQADYSAEEVLAAAEHVALDQYHSGVGLLLDIGNSSFADFDSCPLEIVSLLEMLAPTAAAEQAAITSIAALSSKQKVTAHAPYSTTPGLLQYIKKRAQRRGDLFSLHLAENRDEALLLEKGEGCFVDFLKERGALDTPFPIPEIDKRGVVGYFQKLGILDKKTICVHCVHLTAQALKSISDSHAHICLCPASNQFLGVGIAPLQKILNHNILPALGTDSIASNPELDMWHEMYLLRREHPSVAPETILAMATIGGARAMGRENEYGSLGEGQSAHIIHVRDKQYQDVSSAEQLLDRLTLVGRPAEVQWL